ncbi:hypothetical protein AB0D83_24195 [Streptomyces decoyicus]
MGEPEARTDGAIGDKQPRTASGPAYVRRMIPSTCGIITAAPAR